MTTADQINKKLNEEYDLFLNAKYAGDVAIPSYIISLFKKAIMSMSPYAHKINFIKVKVISGMRVDELTNGLLQDVVKVVLNTPLDKLHEDVVHSYGEIIDKHIEIEKFVLAYNKHIDNFRKKLEMRKATLESLSGARNNGMRVIPQA